MLHNEAPEMQNDDGRADGLPVIVLNYQVTRRKSFHYVWGTNGEIIGIFYRVRDLFDALDALDITEFELHSEDACFLIGMSRLPLTQG